jgi:hypothetical protein
MQARPPARRPTALLIAAVLALTPAASALAQQDNTRTGDRATDMAVDLVVVRPLGLVGAVIGTAGFIVALPFTLPTGTAGETARAWIGEPLEYTFNRPLGEFDVCGKERRPCGAGR